MNISSVDSALDIAGWFYNKAKSEGLYLEHERLQHLLFLSQAHYAIANNNAMLMPSLFICSRDGFFEPSIAKMISISNINFPDTNFNKQIEMFLEAIWKKYSLLSLRDLGDLIKTRTSYNVHYISGKKNIVSLSEMIKNFNIIAHLNAKKPIINNENKKVLFSQNGPVVVSKWHPRKL